jgi:cholesterol oxidase
MSLAPMPESISLRKRNVLRRAALRMGRQVFDPPEAVSWTESPGPGRQACRLCAECEFGCQYGAKHTMDQTYLARAEALGAQVLPRMLVSHVEPAPGGGYRVHCQDLATGQRRTVEGTRVVLSAGTLGTVEILLRSRDKARTLPRLSQRLGHGYSATGTSWLHHEHARGPGALGGPDCSRAALSSTCRASFTMAAPLQQARHGVLTGMGQPRLSHLLQGRGRTAVGLPQAGAHTAFSKDCSERPAAPRGPGAHDEPLRLNRRDNANVGRLGLKATSWTGVNTTRENRRSSSGCRSHAGGGAAVRRHLCATRHLAALQRPITVHSLGERTWPTSPETRRVSRGQAFNYACMWRMAR